MEIISQDQVISNIAECRVRPALYCNIYLLSIS